MRDSRGRRICGTTLSAYELYIGFYKNDNRNGWGLNIELGAVDKNSKSLEYGLYVNDILYMGKCYKCDSRSIRWFMKRNAKIDGTMYDVNLHRFYQCSFSKGKREGCLFIRNYRFHIDGMYHNNKLDGRFTIHCDDWKKHLYYGKGICTYGKIEFSNNMKFILQVENGSELITSVVHESREFSNPMDLISNVPQSFCCPISLQCMSHPVSSTSFRFFYDRKSLQKWFTTKQTEPLTNIKLGSKKLFVNFDLQNQIYKFLHDYFLSFSD